MNFDGTHEKNPCKKQIFFSFSKINVHITRGSWVQVIGENSFLRIFFPVGITFHFMSSVVLSNVRNIRKYKKLRNIIQKIHA